MSRIRPLKYRDVVACHQGDIPRGTLRAIIEQTGLTTEEFLK